MDEITSGFSLCVEFRHVPYGTDGNRMQFSPQVEFNQQFYFLNKNFTLSINIYECIMTYAYLHNML